MLRRLTQWDRTPEKWLSSSSDLHLLSGFSFGLLANPQCLCKEGNSPTRYITSFISQFPHTPQSTTGEEVGGVRVPERFLQHGDGRTPSYSTLQDLGSQADISCLYRACHIKRELLFMANITLKDRISHLAL